MAGLTEKTVVSEQTITTLATASVVIPEKRYFKIGEVCKIVDIKQHVVRYWETEFKQFIKPQRASSKQRLYRRADIENLLRIKQLLKGDGFTIPGARKFLAAQPKSAKKNDKSTSGPESLAPAHNSPQLVSEIKEGLESVLRILEGKD